MREIDHHSETPVYRQVADAIRAEIEAGRLHRRRPLPGEMHLQQEFGVARDMIRRAIPHLAELGPVRTVAITRISPEPGMRIITRPPRDAERAEMGLGAGVWVGWPRGPTEALRCFLGTRRRSGWNSERLPRWSGGLCPAARRGRLPCAAVRDPTGCRCCGPVSVGSLVYSA
ncbi:GntR family transcriptional regulator [Streptosporangium amethystogenes]|uniref:GntR family transcriptional regulator n=1 Tax=Streptosporangium amethystogenes TaxID=2002 RepID=UPI00378F32A2